MLSLGSNLGNRYAYLLMAKYAIEKSLNAESIMARVYSTPPWGDRNQPLFLNTVLILHTDAPPERIIEQLQSIEQEMGKKKIRNWGPRCIDIDILFYGIDVVDTDSLHIPHKHLHERAFVLAPLVDLLPDFVHPKLAKSIDELLLEVVNDTFIFAP